MQQEILPTEQPKKYNILSAQQKRDIRLIHNQFSFTQEGFQFSGNLNPEQTNRFLNDLIPFIVKISFFSHLFFSQEP